MKNKQIVGKIITYIGKLQAYCRTQDYESFESNSVLVDACVFNLSQIGELANKTDADFRTAHPEIPWKQMIGLRNRIVHDYEGVQLHLVWDILAEDLPELLTQLKQIKW